MSIADEIERLQRLRESGALTDAEFAAAKAAVLGSQAEGESSDAVSREIADLRRDSRIARLDSAWALERERYMVSGKHGHRYLPTKGGSMFGGIAAVVFGIIFIGFAASKGAPGLFVLFGVVFVIIGAGISFHGFSKASDYERAEENYRQERDRLSRDKA